MTLALSDHVTAWPPPRAALGGRNVREDWCAADPALPPKGWIYQEASIGFVLSGWFEYHTEGASALAAPGAVVFGNAGECFNVRHLDAHGNTRLVVFLESALMDEVANACGLDAPRFNAITLPPGRVATQLYALMRAAGRTGGDDMLYPLAQAALTAPKPPAPARVGSRDRQRVQAVVDHIDQHFGETCALDTLATRAGLSRCHFVRVFGAVVGQSPNQYLINRRMRAAAERLIATRTPIAQLALEVGFNDLSYFYSCFKGAFGCTPGQWRKRAAA